MSTFNKEPTLVDIEESDQKELPLLPSHIGEYKIESILSEGGMSVLYLALHPKTHELITIKVLSRKYLLHKEIVERFMREAEIIAMTFHPNIVKLYGHGKWEGGLYIAMEFIQGISLRQMILQQTMSLKRALEVVMQIAHALAHLHAHGVIHRDLKPENILLTAQGGVKVIDFGIAAVYNLEEKGGAKKALMGTPAYMSPEQRENPFNLSYNSDIYSLAVVAYELVLGRLSHGVIHLALMPKGLQKILGKALQPNPHDRYPDIIDFIQDLSIYLAGDEIKEQMRGSDYLGELNEDLKEAALQLCEKTPTWPQVEIAINSNSTTALSSVTYDFFQKGNVYHILLSESVATGVEGLLYSATIRGMLRALNDSIQTPKELLTKLNELLVAEGKEHSYSLSFLTLVPLENRFSYISCGYSPLWHLPSGTTTPRKLVANNIALGITDDIDLIEIDSNWNVGDSILLHTFQAGQSKSIQNLEEDENQFAEALTENLYLPPKPQVEAIFRKITASTAQNFVRRPITLISIQRT